MKHLRLFESFKKPYYEFNATEFYTVFKEIFNKEKEKNPDFSGDFFKLLDKLEYLSIPLDNTTETLIQNILQDKEVEFVDLAGDINTGRVKKTQFYYSFFFKKFSYAIDLYDSLTKYGYPEDIENFVSVDYSKPVKIYGEPTEMEKYIDLYLTTNKYNL